MKDAIINDPERIKVLEAIDAMKEEAGERFSLDTVNLAELERRTGVSRARLRRLKENRFVFK